MCWLSDEYKAPNIADEDIIVYKVMLLREGYRNELASFYYGKRYVIGKEYIEETETVEPVYLYHYSINKGFHSYSLEKTTEKECYNHCQIWSGTTLLDYVNLGIDVHYGETLVAVKCIIPKGSTYYENDLGEIVSDRIIITDKIFKKFKNKGGE